MGNLVKKDLSTVATGFVSMLKIVSICYNKPTYMRLIIHELAIGDRYFYRRINELRSMGCTIKIHRDGRYEVQELSSWMRHALDQMNSHHTANTQTND